MTSNKYLNLHTYTNLSREEFLSFMKTADVMVGNSSAGIVEAASFGTPVVNIGNRQNHRQRRGNVVDVSFDVNEITSAIERAFARGKVQINNIYGDGTAGESIVNILESVSLDDDLLNKVLTY
jgi:GDP/UDP-N,N'-diacetylbacillosamine 2-epimerase (hydrolysing)